MTTTIAAASSQKEREGAEEMSAVTGASGTGLGTWFLRDMWYFAVPSAALKSGKMIARTMLGEPVLLGRDNQGKAFALRDICPHQAVPLSEGQFDGCEIMCCFHGWRFDTSGTCTSIPSLVEEQARSFPVCKVKTPSYPCREARGAVWVYFGEPDGDLPEVPEAPGLGELFYEQSTTTLLLPVHIDYAALALIDPAHVPFVHNSWWWRNARSLKPKAKRYVGEGSGWTMVKHQPSKHSFIFKLIGQYIETEISFRLPGCRREYLTLAGRTFLSGISTLTPVDETHTELNHTTYWTFPGTGFISPVVHYFVNEFLGQDKSMAIMQERCLVHKPKLIPTIKDAGTPGAWYLMLKKEWADSRRERRAFRNPVPDTVLRWMS